MANRPVTVVSLLVIVLLLLSFQNASSLRIHEKRQQQHNDERSIEEEEQQQQQQQQLRDLKESRIVSEVVDNIIDELQNVNENSNFIVEAVKEVVVQENTNTDIMATTTSNGLDNNNSYVFSDEDVEIMRMKLVPKSFEFVSNQTGLLRKQQFVHLHHMKTGGTSIDKLISCALHRYEQLHQIRVNSYTIHECSDYMYDRCTSGQDMNCLTRIREATVLRYCAPLKDLPNPFEWPILDSFTSSSSNSISQSNSNDVLLSAATTTEKVHAITVFRHPVARVWSMYRFQTKSCYSCMSLKEIYDMIDQDGNSSNLRKTCSTQLMNHLTRNVLLSNEHDNDLYQYDSTLVQQAITNMREFFTLIGMTEDMETTYQMIGKVFPWLNETYNSMDDEQGVDTTTSPYVESCPLPHANASPTNNRCGPNDTHLPLPDIPDKETMEIIIQHNQMDIELYEAAMQQFQLQKVALQM